MAQDDITRISLGKFQVGITGLNAAIAELKPLKGRPEEEIAQALFEKLKPHNYMPAAAVEDYRQAFLREFKRAWGEPVEEDRAYPSIKILGPGCSICRSLEQEVLVALSELNLPADVEHVKDMQEIAGYGVMSMPALVINGEVRSVGAPPPKDTLKKWLRELQGPPG